MSSSAVTSPILTDTRIRPRLKHHHSEGSIGGSQLTRRTDVQVGQDDGGGTVPAGVWTIVISGNISIIIRSLVLSEGEGEEGQTENSGDNLSGLLLTG